MLYGRYTDVPTTDTMPNLSNVYTYQPAITYGIKPGDNITTTLPTVTDNVGFKEGAYYITASIEVDANIYFAPGAQMIIADGVTVTFNGNVAGQPYQIFTGGNVRFNGNTVVYPEWFGAITYGEDDDPVDVSGAFQAAIDSLEYTGGCVVLQPGRYKNVGDNEEYAPFAGCYYVEHEVFIRHSNISFGCANGSKAMIFSYGNSLVVGGENWVESVTVHDLMLYSLDDTAIAMQVSNTARSEVRDVRIFKYYTGVSVSDTVNQHFVRVEVSPFLSDVEDTTCFYIDDTPVGNISPNASMVFDRCLANMYDCGAGAMGWHFAGDDMRDCLLSNCETAAGEVGYYFDGSTSQASQQIGMNIRLDGCIADQFTDCGIKLYNCHNAIVIVNGGYFSGAVASHNCIFIRDTNNVTVTGVQFQGDTGIANDYCGVNTTLSTGTVVTGCQFLNCREGVRVTAGIATVSNNDFVCKSNPLTNPNLLLLIAIICEDLDDQGGGAVISGNVFHSDSVLDYDFAISTITSSVPSIITGNYIGDNNVAYNNDDVVVNNIGGV